MRKVGDRWREDGGKKRILLASYVVVGGREEDILLLRATEAATAEANAYAHRMPIAGDGDDFPRLPYGRRQRKKIKKETAGGGRGGTRLCAVSKCFCLFASLPLSSRGAKSVYP